MQREPLDVRTRLVIANSNLLSVMRSVGISQEKIEQVAQKQKEYLNLVQDVRSILLTAHGRRD